MFLTKLHTLCGLYGWIIVLEPEPIEVANTTQKFQFPYQIRLLTIGGK